MPDQDKLETWKTYQAAWADMPADQRRAMLAKSVTDNCIYSDPSDYCEGVDALIVHIEGSLAKWPGLSFRNDKLLEHHDQGLSFWTMFDGDGGVVVTGHSYACFGANGRLTRMTGFFDLKKS